MLFSHSSSLLSQIYYVQLFYIDGITLSNSHHLLKNKGWKGVLVDASPVCIERAKKPLLRAAGYPIFEYWLGGKQWCFGFLRVLNTLGQKRFESCIILQKRSYPTMRANDRISCQKIQVCDFKTFLGDDARYKQADFITIDIEGLDYEILSSIALDQTQTRLICVEHNGHNIQKYIDYFKKYNMQVISQNAENLLMGRNLNR